MTSGSVLASGHTSVLTTTAGRAVQTTRPSAITVPDTDVCTTTSDRSGSRDLLVGCFCRGTLILTDRGEVPVEVLGAGARLVTRDGTAKPIKWIGQRSYAGGLATADPKVLPVCFKPGSLADGVPRRELWVSPEHAMYLDGVLVPAELLVNGSSIVKAEAVQEVHYFLIELDRHDVILAEGAWAECSVDDDKPPEYSELSSEAPTRYCASRVDDGFQLEALRHRLGVRARQLLPDGTLASAALQGNLEVVTHSRIAGWARDPEAPGARVTLAVYANGAEIGRLTADRYRRDLEEAGIGDGAHAFELELPGGLVTTLRHKIEVCRADYGTQLPGSPAILASGSGKPTQRDAPSTVVATVPLGPLRGNLDHVDHFLIRGWAQDCEASERRVGLVVTVNGRVIDRLMANRYRADLETAEIGSGRHGFELVLPTPLSPFEAQQIRVVREADGAELPGSPLTLLAATRLDTATEQALIAILSHLAPADEARALALLVREADQLLARRAERQSARAEREALRLYRRRWGKAPAGREADGKRALVIDAELPDTDRDAGSVAILSHTRALRALGYAVSFVAAEATHDEAALELLAKVADVTACGFPYYSCVEDVLSRQAGTFDLIYLHRAAIADRYLPLARRYCPKAQILYSVADLHHLRLARQAQVEGHPTLLAHSQHMAAVEAAVARRSDIVVTHSPVEAEMLRRWVGPAKVHVVPFAVSPRRPRRPFAERSGVAFIGNAAHPPNGDAVYHLAYDILPRVWDVDPTIICKIVGHGWQARQMPPFDPRIVVVGALRDLDELFDTVRLTLAPLRFGAGIKGKVLDSFAAGLPCVMTPIAAEGLPLTDPLLDLVGENPDALAEKALRLHGDIAANTRIAEAAIRLMADEFCIERVNSTLAAALSVQMT